MKQQPTIEEWGELTEEQMREFWRGVELKDRQAIQDHIILNTPSIGQMIEYLVGKKDEKLHTMAKEDLEDETPEWELEIRYVNEECFIGYQVYLRKNGREVCKACKRDKYKEELIRGDSWENLSNALLETVKYKLKP